MLTGKGLSTKILWFFNAVIREEKIEVTFRINDSTRITIFSFTPTQPHEIWVKDNLYRSEVEDFMADVFNQHFMNDPIDITKFPQAYGVCVRIKRALQKNAI